MRSKAARKSPAKREEPTSEIETFLDPRGYFLTSMIKHQPSAFNGKCDYRRWRVTATLIDEPQEVLAERVRKLWRECHNHHNWNAIRAAAAEVGITLDDKERGTEPDKSWR